MSKNKLAETYAGQRDLFGGHSFMMHKEMEIEI